MTDRFAPEVSRRAVLKGAALTGVAAFIAACTGTRSSAAPIAASQAPATSGEPGSSEAPAPTEAPQVTGPLMFANWPAYIDLAGKAGDDGVYEPGSSPSLVEFQKEFSVQVDYQEKIGDNNAFVETIKPALVAGLATGWDLMVLTDWMASQIVTSGWVEKIDQSHVPNCTANLEDSLRNQPWDPGNDYHYPWQSGMTGVGYNEKTLTENSIPLPTKIADLWSIPPDKLTMLTEARDTFGLTLLKLGKSADPAETTDADLDEVYADIKPLVDGGLRFTGNEYLQDFAQKKVWAAYVWSGDLASSGGEDDRFIIPEEGALIWTDNMLIPKGAANKYTAELMMDWVYDPATAAMIAAYIYYVSPVKGAAAEIKALDPGAESNPLLFPTPEVVAKLHNFQALTPEQEDKMNKLFADLSGV